MKKHDEIKAEAVAEGRDPNSRRLLAVLSAVALLALITAVIAGFLAWQSATEDAQIGQDFAAEVEAACATTTATGPTLDRLCEQAEQVQEQVPGPAGPPGPQGEQGEQGPAPSDAQVANAVALFCADGRCDGRSVTKEDVATAVATYCNNRGQCRGPSGEAGATGDTGAAGPQGPPPTDEQVLAAVNTYCGNHGECRGPEGPTGQTGVVEAVDQCDPAPEGQYISDVSAAYNEGAKTIVLSCQYADLFPPGNG